MKTSCDLSLNTKQQIIPLITFLALFYIYARTYIHTYVRTYGQSFLDLIPLPSLVGNILPALDHLVTNLWIGTYVTPLICNKIIYLISINLFTSLFYFFDFYLFFRFIMMISYICIIWTPIKYYSRFILQ